MYNLTIDEAQTFYVGHGDWLVHNEVKVIVIHADREIWYGPYGELSAEGSPKPDGSQAHHLNQDAVYSKLTPNPIPQKDGISIALFGNAFTDYNSWHYGVHNYMENFWDQYRKGGAKASDRPTHLEILEAQRQALASVGFKPDEVKFLYDLAYNNLIEHKINVNEKIKEPPGRINQKQPPNSNGCS